MKRFIIAIGGIIGLGVLLISLCISSVSCQSERDNLRLQNRPSSTPIVEAVPERAAEPPRTEVFEDQSRLRTQSEAARQQRIDELMSRARAYKGQGQYEAALGQVEALLAIDPLHSEALTLKQDLEDAIYIRKQLELNRLANSKHEADIELKTKESMVPYPDEITYPKDWREMVTKGEPAQPSVPPTSGPEEKRGGRILYQSRPGFPPGELTRMPTTVVPLRDVVDWKSVMEDEVWVIVREETPVATGPEYETPGCGAMLVEREGKKNPLPLKHTDVKAKVSGYIATVEVVQQFQNPYSEKIEAVYVFPLPHDAAVNEFIMVIGARRIRGIIREREEAEQIYKEARRQGYVASLLTQERPNIFTQKVANIEPDRQIDVHIKYFNTLAYADGWYEFVFPMVVGPRFNPPGQTDGVGAVGRGHAGLSGQDTEVQYLKPRERNGHDIALAVDIDAGVKIEEVACRSHAIRKTPKGAERVHVQLSPMDNVPNKDFVLRFKVAGDEVKSALVTHRDERGGFFTLMLYPPDDLRCVRRAPMEMVFVIDCSGSMNGWPLAKAKEAVKRALRQLEPDDTFQVIQFAQSASDLGGEPVPATPKNIQVALYYVDALEAGGGTMMMAGIKAALDFPHDPRRLRLVSFMTDGFIGNEAEILSAIHDRLGASRIFSFGVGSSVNRHLLDGMAKLGKGAVAYIGLHDNDAEAVDRFYDCISHPALTDVRIDWGELDVSNVYPKRIPDLFVGRPIVLTGRFQGRGDTTVRVTGRAGEFEKEIRIPVALNDTATHPGIACVWARKRIEELATQAIRDQDADVADEIKQVALRYSLMSDYTAFVAVDSAHVTKGDHGVTVAVPVPVPDGVRYDTTVQD